MPEPAAERRRSPRSTVPGPVQLELPVTWTVQLLDISLGGVLMTGPPALRTGSEVHLRTFLGRDCFTARVRISRTAPAVADPSRVVAGAMFVALDQENDASLRRFLRHEES
jgi:hypothetical protein